MSLTVTFTEAFGIFLNNFHWVVVGVIVGMILGTLPGMGGLVTVSILIPLTIGMDAFSAFALLSGGIGATTFSGSITAILINVPGSPANIATVIDGYKLTQKGEASLAISTSAVASASGAFVAIIIFIALIPVMLDAALLFGPSEIFWIIVFAFLIIPLLIGDRPIMGLVMAGLGCLLAFVGTAPQAPGTRFTFGSIQMSDGLHVMPMVVGLFALAEIYKLASSNRETIVKGTIEKVDSAPMAGIRTVVKHKWLWFRCAILGTVVGMMPGAGGETSSFVAYGHAVQSSKNSEEFGHGRIEGVLGPEAANDAKDGAQLIPTLGLGIPGSATMAVFLSGLLIHGMFPGPRLVLDETHLVLVIALSILASNVLTSIIGLAFANQFTRLLKFPLFKILPVITVLSLAAVFITRFTALDLYFAILFGFLGIALMYYNISRVPLILAFILTPVLEQNFYLAHAYAGYSYYEGFFTGWLNWVIIIAMILSVVLYVAPTNRIPFLPSTS